MKYLATSGFWYHYRQLPEAVRELADKNFALLKADPTHPSLRFKKIDMIWSVRVGLHYRALAKEHVQGLVWFWIGHHREYDQLLKN